MVASRQNTATSELKAFNFSVTVDPSGTPTGMSLGGSMAEANRRYTDTPTTVEAEAGVDVRVGRTTYLAGAMLNARSGPQTVSLFMSLLALMSQECKSQLSV